MGYEKLVDSENIEELLLKYGFAKKKIETELDILIGEYSFLNKYNPVEHVKSRIKLPESVLKKLLKKGYEFTCSNIVEHVHDMVGLRIVCSFLTDVKTIVNIIKSSKNFIIKEESDYITNPKKSGYISYHMNVLVPLELTMKTEYIEVEIQIRTVAMDFWASLDHKLRYKLPGDIPNQITDEIYTCSEIIRSLDREMEKLNNEIKEIRKS